MSENKVITELASLIPDGLSSEGKEEIAKILEGYVEKRVDTEVSKVETSVASMFRTKIDDLKVVAHAEIVNEDSTVKAVKYFNDIMVVVADYVDNEMIDSRLRAKEEQLAEARNNVKNLNAQLNELVSETTQLKNIVSVLKEEKSLISEELLTTRETLSSATAQIDEDFQSSETAVVIANENLDGESIQLSDADNQYLNSEVMQLTESLLSTNKNRSSVK